jgi:hypothetical protein
MTDQTVEDLQLSCADTAGRTTAALNQCTDLIKHFEGKADKSKRSFGVLRYSTIVLTVGVATMAAVPPVPRWLIAILSAIAALCAALITALRPQEVWLQSRSTQQQLQAERFLFLQGARDYSQPAGDDRVKLFAERITEIWSAGHARWEQGRQQAATQPVEVVGKSSTA